jgi:hypothetical protein
MKTLFAVPWIEVEYGWGERNEGYKIFDKIEECISSTKNDSETGNYSSGEGYFGPVRPLFYYEIADEIVGKFPTFVEKIEFKSNPHYIK